MCRNQCLNRCNSYFYNYNCFGLELKKALKDEKGTTVMLESEANETQVRHFNNTREFITYITLRRIMFITRPYWMLTDGATGLKKGLQFYGKMFNFGIDQLFFHIRLL